MGSCWFVVALKAELVVSAALADVDATEVVCAVFAMLFDVVFVGDIFVAAVSVVAVVVFGTAAIVIFPDVEVF